MPADAELRVRAAVEQAIQALRQVKGEIAGVKNESRAATATQAGDAAENVKSTLKQREALVALAGEYSAVAASAKRGSEEQQAAARMAAETQARANRMIAETSEGTKAATGGMNLLGKTIGIVFGGAIAAKGLSDIVNMAKEAQTSQVLLANTMQHAGQSYTANRKQIEASIDTEARLAGIQRVDLRTSFQQLDRVIVSSTGTRGAVTKATYAMNLAADIARARHISLAQATKMITQVELGRVTQMRRIGIALPQVTTAEDKLRDSHAKVTAEVKAQAKAWDQQQTAIAAVAALHKAYAGSAEAYGKTASGAVDRLHVSWQDFGIDLGQKMLPVIAKASGWLADELDKLDKSAQAHRMLHDATEAVVTAYHDLLPYIKMAVEVTKDVVGWFDRHRAVAEWLAATILTVVTAYKVYKTAVEVAKAAQVAFNLVMDANPVGIIVTAIAALGAAFVIAYQRSAKFRDIVQETGRVAKEILTPALQALRVVATTVFDFLRKHWQLLLDSFGPIGFIAGQVIKHFQAIVAAIEHPIATIQDLWNRLFNWLEQKAVEVALKIVEPFSHLPRWLGGGWAQDMKKNLQGALEGLKETAAMQGSDAASAWSENFTSGVDAALQGVGTGAGGKVNAEAAAKGSHGATLAGRGIPQNAVVRAAQQYANQPYVWGGGHGGTAGPSHGTTGDSAEPNAPNMIGLDCSGFARVVLAKLGINVGGGTADAMYRQASGHPALNQLQPGDLVFYEAGHTHVMVYIGNGKVMGETHTGGGVQVQPAGYMTISGTGRYTTAGKMSVKTSGSDGGTHIPAPTSTATLPSAVTDAAAAAAATASAKQAAKGAGSVATMDQSVKDLQAKIRGIIPASLRDELSKRATDVLDGIRKGLSPEASAKLRSNLKQLTSDVSAAVRLDAAVQTAKDSMGKIRDEITGLPAQVRGPLAARMRQVSAEFGSVINAKDLAQAKRDLADLKTSVAQAMKLDTGIQNARTAAAAIKQQISGWPAQIRGPLAAQVAALSSTLGKVLSAKDLAAAKSQLAQLKTAVTTAVNAAKQAVTDAKTLFEREWQRFSSDALTAFDKVTQATIATQKITVQMAGYSFQFGQGDLTPAAQALQDLQAKTAQDQRDQAAAQAAADVQAKTSALQQLIAVGVGGTAATGAIISQSDIDQAKSDLAGAQQAVDQAALDQREFDLQTQADAEQKAADAQFTTWQDAYQNTRDVQRQVLSDQLADLQAAIEDQKTTWAGAMDDTQGILSKGGADAATAFWTAYNAATAAQAAAGGSNSQTDAQGAAGALGAAQGTAAALTAAAGAGAAAGMTDPGAGTSPDNRGGIRGAGPSTPSFVWGGISWTKGDKADFIRWLTAHGASYATWAGNHPDAATMLAKGALITKPTLAMMGEKSGMKLGEGVIPLDDPRALEAIGKAIASALPNMGGVTAVFPNAIVPGRDRDAARRLARMAGPEINRVIGYSTSP